MNRKSMGEAVALHQQGRHDEADKRYRQLARLFPRDPDLMHFRGLLASHTGNQAEAVRFITEAIALKPDAPEFHQNLAITLQAMGEAQAASMAHNQQGVVLQQRRQLPEALLAFEKAQAQDADNHWAVANHAAVLNELGLYDRALEILRKVEKRLKLPKERSYILSNMGNCHYYLGRSDRALDCFAQAIESYPEAIEAHRNRSVILLAEGKIREGFAEYEWRCTDGIPYSEAKRSFTQPLWRGQSPEELGGAILVLSEQGFGDTIHFSRYVKLLADRGHRVLFEVQPELYALFSEGWAGDDRIRVIRRQPNGKVFNSLPFAAFVSVMSLPDRFGTTLASIPGDTPYLAVSPVRLKQWNSLLPDDGAFKVGLVWRGSANTPHDHLRSMPADALEPLLARKGVRFYSLQVGDAAAHEFHSDNIVMLHERLRDFADTAAAIRHLDLVICIDSAVAHLAGAVGAEVWLPMPAILDWRWMLKREDSPWYPRTKLFRQKKQGDWAGVITDIGRALDRLTANRRAA